LIEKHTILTAPSIQVLQLTRQQWERLKEQGLSPLQGKNAVIVGNPTMPTMSLIPGEPPQQLSPLPNSEKEAVAIANLLNTQALIGDQATKTAIMPQLPNARLIHLATHGLLDDIRGLGSAIALAPDPTEPRPVTLASVPGQGEATRRFAPGAGELGTINGLLTAEEILDLKLNAELVVLSACDTGRGRITGDGVIGLSRALISAGVPSVIVSLWAVGDAPTADLMTAFYQYLQQNPDKAQALRQAMLTTMKDHPNPVDWAAFTLIGEAE
jgi:CHAT domain-containing protein